jgi:predicted esterase
VNSQEHHLAVQRTARYHTLGAAGPAVRELWMVLHGYGQLAAWFLRHFAALDDGTRRFVAPEALSRFYLSLGNDRVGASWMTREDRQQEITDTLDYLDALYARLCTEVPDDVRLCVFGFSQGANAASRWVCLRRPPVTRLILWGGTFAHDLDLAAHRDHLAQMNITLVIGDQDEFISPDKQAAEQQRLQALPYTLHPYQGRHALYADVLRALV